MIATLITFIQTHLLPLGGLGVFAASFLEEIIAPIPSALVILSAGFLFVSGPVDLASLLRLLTVVILPAAAGITTGSLFVYAIAFYAGKPVLEKWGKWLGLTWGDIEKLQSKFSEKSFDEWALFTVRAIPIIPSIAISAFCGLIRYPVRSYLIYSFLGTIIRAAILGFIGWQVGALYFKYARVINTFENVILGLVVAGSVAFVVWNIYRLRAKKPQDPATSA